MFLRINHKTKYRYEKPFQSLTQSIKLFPTKLKGVKILSWKVSVKNAYIGEKVIESNGDQTIVAHTSKNNKSSEIIVTGQVQTSDNNGIILEVHAAGVHLNQALKQNTVLLMAGGFGTRLMPLTDDCPKPLLKVGEKPIIHTIIENFIEYGFHNFVISTHYRSDMIKDYLGNGDTLNCSIEYLQEESPLGTAGCLSLLHPNHINHPIFMMNADILTKVNFTQLLDFHLKAKTSITMCVRNYTHQIPYGVIRTKNHLIETGKLKIDLNRFADALIDLDKAIDVYPKDSIIFIENGKSKESNEDFIVSENTPCAVNLNQFSASSIDILVRCYTKTNDYYEWLKVKDKFVINKKEIIKINFFIHLL